MIDEISLLYPQHEHGRRCIDALAAGVTNLGGKVHVGSFDNSVCKKVAVWGWRSGQIYQKRGHDVLVMECGYLGDRLSWYSLGWNGLNNRAKFASIADPSRLKANFQIWPWKNGGEIVLVIGQLAGDASLGGRDLRPWYESVCEQAKDAYPWPVVFRPHPKTIERRVVVPLPKHVSVSTNELEIDLSRAAVVITYNSNCGVDAVMAGVPTITHDLGAMAWDVSGHELGELLKPDRSEWAAKLAWKQWTLDEISSGDALLLPGLRD